MRKHTFLHSHLKKALTIGFFLVLINTPLFSWNAVGHRLITQIAYDLLTRHEKTVFNHYNRALNDKMAKNLVNASVWLDVIRFRTHYYDTMHYIDIPFSTDGSHLPMVAKVNAITAIQHSKEILLSPQASMRAKGIALRVLIHVVGDIHQPLHTATRISWHYPEGDRGGNLILLSKNKVAKNLHAYWDRGAGLFISKRHVGVKWIKHRATDIEKRWPCSLNLVDVNLWHWAQESHELAVRSAYNPMLSERLAQQIVEQRIAIAGCRLAASLHQLQV